MGTCLGLWRGSAPASERGGEDERDEVGGTREHRRPPHPMHPTRAHADGLSCCTCGSLTPAPDRRRVTLVSPLCRLPLARVPHLLLESPARPATRARRSRFCLLEHCSSLPCRARLAPVSRVPLALIPRAQVDLAAGPSLGEAGTPLQPPPPWSPLCLRNQQAAMRLVAAWLALAALAASLTRASPLSRHGGLIHRRDAAGGLYLDVRDSSGAAPATLFRSAGNVTCDTLTVTFAGSSPPFQLEVVSFDSTNVTLADLGNYSTSGVALWAVSVPSGSVVRLKITDAAGNTRLSTAAAVQDGRDGVSGCSYVCSSSDPLHISLTVVPTLAAACRTTTSARAFMPSSSSPPPSDSSSSSSSRASPARPSGSAGTCAACGERRLRRSLPLSLLLPPPHLPPRPCRSRAARRPRRTSRPPQTVSSSSYRLVRHRLSRASTTSTLTRRARTRTLKRRRRSTPRWTSTIRCRRVSLRCRYRGVLP